MAEKTIHIRLRVPETVVEALRDLAEENMRSLNAEALHLFRKHLGLLAPKRVRRKPK